MIVKKDQLKEKKKRNAIDTFEKVYFLVLSSLSALFLIITGWFLLTGDELIFLHGSRITPQHFCVMLYLHSLFMKKAVKYENSNNSEMELLFV